MLCLYAPSVRCWLNSDIFLGFIISEWKDFTDLVCLLFPLRPAALTTDIMQWKLRGLMLPHSVTSTNCISIPLYSTIVLKFYIYMQISSYGSFTLSQWLHTQINIRAHTDGHLHVLLINILRIHNCVHECSSATEYHTLNLSMSTHDLQVTTDNLLQA